MSGCRLSAAEQLACWLLAGVTQGQEQGRLLGIGLPSPTLTLTRNAALSGQLVSGALLSAPGGWA